MRIYITGINGFIGGSLANYLVEAGHEVSGIGRQEKLSEFVSDRCTYFRGDITKKIDRINADIVIHSAALASDKASYEKLYLNNVKGTENVIEASAQINCFIHISTSSVYAFTNTPMKENEAGLQKDNLSNYGKTKLMAEELVFSKCTAGTRYILRPRAVYGVNDRLILPRLLKLIRGNKIVLPSHITQKISLTSIDNFIQAIQLCITNRQAQTKIYNVADGHNYSLDDTVIALLKRVTGTEFRVVKIPALIWVSLVGLNEVFKFNKDLTRFGSDQLTQCALMDIQAISKELNYKPIKDMVSSYDEIAIWVKQQGGWEKYLEKFGNINS